MNEEDIQRFMVATLIQEIEMLEAMLQNSAGIETEAVKTVQSAITEKLLKLKKLREAEP